MVKNADYISESSIVGFTGILLYFCNEKNLRGSNTIMKMINFHAFWKALLENKFLKHISG